MIVFLLCAGDTALSKTIHSGPKTSDSRAFAEKHQEQRVFQVKFLLKLFFKSLKIILIINFFYILNILFFSICLALY